MMSRVLSRVSRSVGRRSLLLLSPSEKQLPQLPIISNQFHSLIREDSSKIAASQVLPFERAALSFFTAQRFEFTSSASPEPDANGASPNAKANGDTKLSEETEDSASAKSKDSDSEEEDELSMDDLVKLVAEKEEQLKLKHKEVEQMQDKVLRSFAEMENVMHRTKREAENAKKFAIQNFAKSLLDVADNLGRASSVVKTSFSKVDVSNDAAGVVPILKTLLEGVDMTEKQLLEVFKKYGIEKFDPTNEPFDPHRHNAVFQMPDPSKTPGTVGAVLKPGYVLHDRIIRPAEVGVVQEVENDTADN